MLHPRPDGTVDAMCSRCLRSSAVVASVAVLADLGWELRDDGQTWCPDCSPEARVPKRRPDQRGHVRPRRGR